MLREMNCILAISQMGSFSKAAESLYISQPALSATVKKLEAELGTQLIDRSTNPVQITEAGKVYLESVQKILTIQKETQSYFDSLRDLEEGSISIGTTTFYCCYTLPKHLVPFRQRYPKIDFNLIESVSNEKLSEMLIEGKLDVVLTSSPIGFENVEKHFFNKEQLILAVPEKYDVNKKLSKYALTADDILNHKQRKKDCPSVSLKEFKDIPYISLRQGSDLYNRAGQLFENAKVRPKINMYLDQMPTTYYMAYYGFGFAIIRDTTLHMVTSSENDGHKLIFYKIDDPLAEREIDFFIRDHKYMSPALKAFLTYTDGVAKENKR